VPAERGVKDPVGTVLVSFGRTASKLRIAVSDDGRGIDVDGLARAALRMGLASADGLAAMRDEEKVELLFRLGVSTAKTVTDAAGRGVGAAALREAVIAAGGHIEVQNHPGAGATFIIDLPVAEPVTRAAERPIAPRGIGSVRPPRASSLPPERPN
jgi:chemotaxis protein histidine kinase CheA